MGIQAAWGTFQSTAQCHKFPAGGAAASTCEVIAQPQDARYVRGVSVDAALPHPGATHAPIGELLRAWRRRRSLSQLELEELYDELSGYPGISVEAPHDRRAGNAIVLPLRMRAGDRELAFFSTVSTFGTAVEITIAELVIEAFYPANAATASHLLAGIAGP